MTFLICNAPNDHYCEECEWFTCKGGNCRCKKHGISIRWYQYAMDACFSPKPTKKSKTNTK